MNLQLLQKFKQQFNIDTVIFLDFETFYKSKANNGTKSFSLKSMTYANYVFSERFQTTGFGIGEDDGAIEYMHRPEEIAEVMEEIKARRAEGERIALCAHNTRFDGAICGWFFNCFFDVYVCTQDLSKLLQMHKAHSLKACAARDVPELAAKGGAELASVDGIKYEYISEEQHIDLGAYCIHDVELCRALFEVYVQRVYDTQPDNELDIIHITLRGHLEPQFLINREPLFEVIEDKEHEKGLVVGEAMRYCMDCGLEDIGPKTFSSNPQYAELIKAFGLNVPLKVNPKGLMVPALGQADPVYVRLQIDNPALEKIFTARRVIKSTIELSRAQTMIMVSDQFHDRGFTGADMPFFLNYYGAGQTGRWSGGQKLNQQNNTRGGKHRLSMLAPDGYVIDVCDLSNIELRVNLWICGQENLLLNFKEIPDYDLYSEIASDVFGFKVDKRLHKDERQMGKAAALGLGFAMGWTGFQAYLASGPLGMEPMFKSDEFCQNVKNTYDIKHNGIKAMWDFLKDMVIPVIVNGGELRFGPSGMFVARKDSVTLPSGRVLQYANARYLGREDQGGIQVKVVFDSDKRDVWGNPFAKYMWHGLLLENLCQATARDILAWQLVKVDKMLIEEDWGWVAGSVHDEILSMVLEPYADAGHANIEAIMSTGPNWCHGLPLANEGGYAREYSK